MTGEITLRGNILPIGGVREKVLAAHRAGLKIVLLPTKNDKDLVEVPKKVREDVKIILVHHMDEVLEYALVPGESKGNKILNQIKAKNKRKEEAEAEAEAED
ncbi:Lon protease [bioreactor metagenome]|uniref:Lon protease n=1 Tax=bioreactor metagenome TaxID=1076179 RepID=A0A645IM10_9ZZZZ